MKKTNYNIDEYVSNMGETTVMNIGSIFENKKVGKTYVLKDNAHRSLKVNIEEAFYVESNFKDIHISHNPKFILFSAPGATGKSTFAKHITYKYNGVLWDLADIKLGDNSFHGTIYRALGTDGVPKFARDLRDGNTTLIIDAFDEAEMISGRNYVEDFITDINEFVPDHKSASIILLSRTETAQFLAAFMKANSIPFNHYEIGLFAKDKALEFVREKIKREGVLNSVVEECISEYFRKLRSTVTDTKLIENFLCYAPVLDAIAKSIMSIQNTMRLLEDLRSDSNESSIMESILLDILKREHKKVVNALKVKFDEKQIDFEDWDKVYTIKEQMVHLCEYVVYDDVDVNNFKTSELPPNIMEEYNDVLKVFVNQHPFISNNLKENTAITDFAGPSFRDYTMAMLLLDEDYEDYVELYYRKDGIPSNYPTQLFWGHYIDHAKGAIKKSHLPYVYEGFKSKMPADSTSYIDIDEDGDDIIATFGISDKKNVEIECYRSKIVGEGALLFDNLSNVNIDVSCDTKIGYFHDDVRIVNSSISCKNLIIDASTVTIEIYDPLSSLLVVENFEKLRNDTTFEIRGNSNLKVTSPNLHIIPQLYAYKYDLKKNDGLDISIFIYNLKKIFVKFRTHGKDMLGKEADYVNFILLETSELRKSIFDFMLENNIAFRADHLYKINLDKMSEFKISWGALATSNEKQLQTVYNAYNTWCKKD